MRTPFLPVLFAIASCATPQPAPKKLEPAAPPAPAQLPDARGEARARTTLPLPPGVDPSAMNPSADPCDDFYEYACGGWMKTAEIPDDRPLYSRGFVAIQDRNELVLRQILDEAVAGKLPEGTAFARQLADTYATCTDEAKLETALPEVKKFIARYAAPKNARELARAIGGLSARGYSPLFQAEAMQDLKSSSEVIASLDQSGLGLPDRDYYLDEDPKKKAVREAYLAYTGGLLTLFGEEPAEAKQHAAQILELETRLARVSQSRVERRDPANIYHRVDRAGLQRAAPDFPWDVYFEALGLTDVQSLNLTNPAFFEEISRLAKDTGPGAWRPYLTWVVLRASVPALPRRFQDAHFEYTSKNLSGAKADRPRWKKCVGYVESSFGEALGREFVRRTFGEEGKARTRAMVQQLQSAVKDNFQKLSWMDDATRAAAAAKLERMVGNNKIGYPDRWRDYSAVETTRASFFANTLASNLFEVRRELAKVGKPVDRDEWLMAPSAVNAYNEGQKNEIVFPAGILQPPFFDRTATDAVNLGSMGMVVGHEITHGFDDKGRKFDADGNLRDWWTPSIGKDFVARAACVKKQYDDYLAVENLHVKGDLTLGENVADLGGVKLAHAAMQGWYSERGAADDGYRFTRSQQFFLGFAQSWCTKVRPETARLRVAVDTHSPPYWRVVGPLSDSEDFKRAFACREGSKMVRRAPVRCEVW
ncbi:MAG: M13 family metallopeptidase [Myxococcaceae bacterium]